MFLHKKSCSLVLALFAMCCFAAVAWGLPSSTNNSIDKILDSFIPGAAPGDISKPDGEFFDLTPENFRESDVLSWFANWTMTERNSAGYQEHGELPWLFRNIMKVPNFDCSMNRDGDCRERPTLEVLKNRFLKKRGRSFVRILYFMSLWLRDQHDMAQKRERMSDLMSKRVETVVPNLIRHLAYHTKSDLDKRCHAEVEAFQFFISTVIGLVADPMVAIVVNEKKIDFPTIDFRHKLKREETPCRGACTSIWGTVTNEVNTLVKEWELNPNQTNRLKHGFMVVPLDNSPAICHNFANNYPNVDLINKEQAVKFLEGLHTESLRAIWQGYANIYNGDFPTEGRPSSAAYVLEHQNWLGKEGIKEFLKNGSIDNVVTAESHKLTQHMAGKVLGYDENFVTCGWFKEICVLNKADQHFQHNDFSDGLFCPVKGSNIKCMSGRYYRSKNDVWVVGSPAVKGIPSFSLANDEYGDWNYENMMTDAYKRAQSHLGKDQESSTDVGFSVPFCLSEKSVQLDYTAKASWWKGHDFYRRATFPVLCGDHRGYGSLRFLQETIGYQIPTRNDTLPFGNDGFVRSSLPRNMHAADHGPGSWFSLLCQLGLKWPKWKNLNVIGLWPGADPACGPYLKAIKNKNYDEHMRFFCTDPLTRDARDPSFPHIILTPGMSPSSEELDNLGKTCKKWLKKYPEPGSANLEYYANLPYGPEGPKDWSWDSI